MEKVFLFLIILGSITHIYARDDVRFRQKRRNLVSHIKKKKVRGKKNKIKEDTSLQSLQVKHRSLIVPGSGKTLELRGAICVKNNYSSVPQFRVLFDGRETMSNDEGFFSIPTDLKNLDEYSLVITKKIIKEFDRNNTLKGLKVIPDMPYQYFKFTRNIASSEWEMTEKRLFNEDFFIPEHSIVLLLNPQKYIDYIEPWEISFPDDVLKLPLVMLKADMPIDQVNRHSAKSLLYSLDEGVFHDHFKEVCKPKQADGKVKVSRVG